MPEKFFYSVGEVAQRCGVCKNTVRKLISEGTLESFRAGRRLLVPAVALERLASGGHTNQIPLKAEPGQRAG